MKQVKYLNFFPFRIFFWLYALYVVNVFVYDRRNVCVLGGILCYRCE